MQRNTRRGTESEWSNRDDSIASVRWLEWEYFSSGSFIRWYRFHREYGITAINYEGGRPKGIAGGAAQNVRGSSSGRENADKGRTRWRKKNDGCSSLCTQFPRGRRGGAAAVSLRENKVSLPARALALAHARRIVRETGKRNETSGQREVGREEEGRNGSEALINISPGFEARLNWQEGFASRLLPATLLSPLPLAPFLSPFPFSLPFAHPFFLSGANPLSPVACFHVGFVCAPLQKPILLLSSLFFFLLFRTRSSIGSRARSLRSLFSPRSRSIPFPSRGYS